MNLTIEQTKIENPDIAIVCLVPNTKKLMQMGVITPPPPIPATVERAMKTDKMIKPIISLPYAGKTFL